MIPNVQGTRREGQVTKSELIDALAERSNLTKARAELVVNCVFDAMTEALERGEGIEIRGFGSFTVRPYKSYEGRNPRTGEPVPVPAKRLPFFKVGKELKELVNASRSRPITGGDDSDDDHDSDEPDEPEDE
jgi:integration host factor subunit beta